MIQRRDFPPRISNATVSLQARLVRRLRFIRCFASGLELENVGRAAFDRIARHRVGLCTGDNGGSALSLGGSDRGRGSPAAFMNAENQCKSHCNWPRRSPLCRRPAGPGHPGSPFARICAFLSLISRGEARRARSDNGLVDWARLTVGARLHADGDVGPGPDNVRDMPAKLCHSLTVLTAAPLRRQLIRVRSEFLGRCAPAFGQLQPGARQTRRPPPLELVSVCCGPRYLVRST